MKRLQNFIRASFVTIDRQFDIIASMIAIFVTYSQSSLITPITVNSHRKSTPGLLSTMRTGQNFFFVVDDHTLAVSNKHANEML